jgi:predicted dehydrogenase
MKENRKICWLIGAGYMGLEYTRVLKSMEVDFLVISKGTTNIDKLKNVYAIDGVSGGLDLYLEREPVVPEFAIVAVSVEELMCTTCKLMELGVKKILVEKPAGLNKEEIVTLNELAVTKDVDIFVAYNRRFYASVLKSKEIIDKDGGVISFNFEFTEWSHEIENLEKPQQVKEHWFLGNSTHVVDLAFFLGGKPKEIKSYISGGLDWHHSSSIFSGAGISDLDALFSYQANWEAPGRWGIEILTKSSRLIFRPLEKLQIQKIGSVKIEFVEIDDYLDTEYKPGLFVQTRNFLSGNTIDFCTLKDQLDILDVYNQMANY